MPWQAREPLWQDGIVVIDYRPIQQVWSRTGPADPAPGGAVPVAGRGGRPGGDDMAREGAAGSPSPVTPNARRTAP